MQDHESLLTEAATGKGWGESRLDGRYRLVRPLAKVTSGGCVFAAEHVHTKRTCAIKLLDRRAREPVRKRMYREMEALARVQGPGAVDERARASVRFALPLTGRILEVRAVCRWTRATRAAHAAGFELIGLGAEAVAEIAKYVTIVQKL